MRALSVLATLLAAVDAQDGAPRLDRVLAARIDDATPEARRRWPNEAAAYLLHEAANTPEVHAHRSDLLPLTRATAAAIDEDSAPFRFRFVRFRGELERVGEQDYAETYGRTEFEPGRVWRGRVRTPDGVRVVFVTASVPAWSDPNGPEPAPEMRLLEDGRVRGRGILVQNFSEPIEDGGARGPSVLVVVTALDRDYEPVPVRGLGDVPFDLVRDDPALAATADGRLVLAKDWPRALFRLVKHAEARAGAPGAERRKADGLEPRPLDDEAQWDAVLQEPANHRAAYFGGTGMLVMEPQRYGPESIEPNDAGVDECVGGWIFTEGRRLLQFVAPAPVAGTMKEKDRVRWEGFFYKVKLYPARDGTDRLTLLLVLTVLERQPPRPPVPPAPGGG